MVASIAVGGRKCSSVGGDSWQTGYEVEGTALSTSINLADEYESEVHFSLSAADGTDGALYEFELYDGTVGSTRGTCGATLTLANIPTVTTQNCDSISYTTATGNGNITNTGGLSITRRGFCYMEGTSGDPTTANSVAYDDGTFSSGAYTKGLTGLTANTGYRVRAYAVNSMGTSYGTTVQLTTTAYAVPTVTTSACTDVTATSATGVGNITATGGVNATRKGFCYVIGIAGDPTTSDSVVYDDGDYGISAISKSIGSLTSGAKYRVRAYATNTAGTGYGTTVQLTLTNAAPTVALNSPSMQGR